MSLLLTLIVYVIVLGLLWYLVQMLPLPAPAKQIVNVLFILLLIVIVLSTFGMLPIGNGFPMVRLR